MMKNNRRKELWRGIALIQVFVIWTILIQHVDVKSVGVNGTDVGFAMFNAWFHQLTGVHWHIYTITDWLGLVPIAVCLYFAAIGLLQLIRRRSLFRVDSDIVILGIYYAVVILAYLVFEMVPINYRPVLVEGYMEASYPSSTTLLVLSVMPTLVEQSRRRCRNEKINTAMNVFAAAFSLFMVVGRMVSGVHWFTDIVGSVLLSAGLFQLYRAVVLLINETQ